MKLFAVANKLPRQLISAGGLPIGIWLNLGSAVALYLATLFLRKGQAIQILDSQFYLWMRYMLGASIYLLAIFWLRPLQIPAKARKYVFWRAILNALAVLCFYKAVEWGEAGQANVLNMTYPIFVVLLAGPVLGEHPDSRTIGLVLLAMLGILLNFPDLLLIFNEPVATETLLARGMGLLSAVVAAFAILALRGATREVNAHRVLFWMFLFGAVVFAPTQSGYIGQVQAASWPYILASAGCGVLGQFLITLSFIYLPAATGSIVSTARIPIALLAGFVFLAEPVRPLAYAGAALIAGANVLLALRSKGEKLG